MSLTKLVDAIVALCRQRGLRLILDAAHMSGTRYHGRHVGLEGDLRSDVAPLNGLVREALRAGGEDVVAMKDPTRGGVAGVLHEMAAKGNVGILVDEAALPIRDEVRAASEMIGIDPLLVANEGKAILGVRARSAEKVLAALRAHAQGKEAASSRSLVLGLVFQGAEESIENRFRPFVDHVAARIPATGGIVVAPSSGHMMKLLDARRVDFYMESAHATYLINRLGAARLLRALACRVGRATLFVGALPLPLDLIGRIGRQCVVEARPPLLRIGAAPDRCIDGVAVCHDAFDFSHPRVINPGGDKGAAAAKPFRIQMRILFGNAGIGIVEAPGYANWDFAVGKKFSISEKKYFDFRAEFFNFTNHPSFAPPAVNLNSANDFGKITRTVSSSRNLEFVLKFYF